MPDPLAEKHDDLNSYHYVGSGTLTSAGVGAGYPVDDSPFSQSILGLPSLSETNEMVFSKGQKKNIRDSEISHLKDDEWSEWKKNHSDQKQRIKTEEKRQ